MIISEFTFQIQGKNKIKNVHFDVQICQAEFDGNESGASGDEGPALPPLKSRLILAMEEASRNSTIKKKGAVGLSLYPCQSLGLNLPISIAR